MNVAVSLTPGTRSADLSLFGEGPGAYVVIDILRASTVLCTALANGAAEISPVADVDAARRLKANDPARKILLCGERGGARIEGFDLGNSPSEYTPKIITGRHLAYASTNGSVALAQAPKNVEVTVAGLVNISAAAEHIVERNLPALIVCAGKFDQFALEDVVGAGALIARLWELDPDLEIANDGAFTAQILWDHFKSDPVLPLWQSDHGKYLISQGFGADLAVCAGVDSLSVVPVMRDGRLIAAGN
ncbi:MAG: 2-phosphosulfolactate phosphatase [candidate division Zixibacteria bacterium]|nr:2-phosphosulfolactate phosphatase [candidate division Zixibacteria bacterium]